MPGRSEETRDLGEGGGVSQWLEAYSGHLGASWGKGAPAGEWARTMPGRLEA